VRVITCAWQTLGTTSVNALVRRSGTGAAARMDTAAVFGAKPRQEPSI
jgi:hypothetical protein